MQVETPAMFQEAQGNLPVTPVHITAAAMSTVLSKPDPRRALCRRAMSAALPEPRMTPVAPLEIRPEPVGRAWGRGEGGRVLPTAMELRPDMRMSKVLGRMGDNAEEARATTRLRIVQGKRDTIKNLVLNEGMFSDLRTAMRMSTASTHRGEPFQCFQMQELVGHASVYKATFRFTFDDIERVQPSIVKRIVETVQTVMLNRLNRRHTLSNPSRLQSFVAYLYAHTCHPIATVRRQGKGGVTAFVQQFARIVEQFREPEEDVDDDLTAGGEDSQERDQDAASVRTSQEAYAAPAPRVMRATTRVQFFVVFPMIMTRPVDLVADLIAVCDRLTLVMPPTRDASVVAALGDRDDSSWWAVSDVVGIDAKVKRELWSMRHKSMTSTVAEHLGQLIGDSTDVWVPPGASGRVVDCTVCKEYQSYVYPSATAKGRKARCMQCHGHKRIDLGFRTNLLAVFGPKIRRAAGKGVTPSVVDEASTVSSDDPRAAARKRSRPHSECGDARCLSPLSETSKSNGGIAEGPASRLNVPETLIREHECCLLTYTPESSQNVIHHVESARDIQRDALAFAMQMRVLDNTVSSIGGRNVVFSRKKLAFVQSIMKMAFPEMRDAMVVGFRPFKPTCFTTLLPNGKEREVVVEVVLSGPEAYHCCKSHIKEEPVVTAGGKRAGQPCCKYVMERHAIVVYHYRKDATKGKECVKRVVIHEDAWQQCHARVRSALIYYACTSEHSERFHTTREVREHYVAHGLVPENPNDLILS